VRTLLQIALALAFGYGVLVAYVFFFQARLIYFPGIGGGPRVTPADAGLAYDEVRFRAADGPELHGWYVPAEGARATVLFMHGNAGDIRHRLDTLAFFHRLGLSVFIFDYRGYGESEGRTTEAGTYADAQAAWRYLVEERGAPPERIVLFGRSLGAAVAAWLAAREGPAALIIESAFTSAPELAAKYYWYLPVHWLARFHYDTRAALGRVGCPVLVLHSREDEIIPFAHGQALYAAAAGPKQFVELRGGHNEAFFVSQAVYAAALGEFLHGAGVFDSLAY